MIVVQKQLYLNILLIVYIVERRRMRNIIFSSSSCDIFSKDTVGNIITSWIITPTSSECLCLVVRLKTLSALLQI